MWRKTHINGRSVKKNTYVRCSNGPSELSRNNNRHGGGSYPSWDRKLVLDMSIREIFTTLEGHCRIFDCEWFHGIESIYQRVISSFWVIDWRSQKGDQNGIINVPVRLRVPEYLALCLKTNVQHHNLRASALPVMDGKNYVWCGCERYSLFGMLNLRDCFSGQ